MKIILASRSKARKALLRQIGLRFSVVVSNVKEISKIRGTYHDLVILNALRKAQAVAQTHPESFVIAADTVVVVRDTILGKPRSRKEAYTMIKMLSRNPQWVYTGLAIINTKIKKTVTGFEKTKVFLRQLTEQEIRQYLSGCSYRDKAGGFDIQGRGGVFVRRIEGCFSNVVGLPLAKLAVLMQKTGYSRI